MQLAKIVDARNWVACIQAWRMRHLDDTCPWCGQTYCPDEQVEHFDPEKCTHPGCDHGHHPA